MMQPHPTFLLSSACSSTNTPTLMSVGLPMPMKSSGNGKKIICHFNFFNYFPAELKETLVSVAEQPLHKN